MTETEKAREIKLKKESVPIRISVSVLTRTKCFQISMMTIL